MKGTAYSNFHDVFENKSKPVEKVVRRVLLACLAISFSVAILLQFGWIHVNPSKSDIAAQPGPAPEHIASSQSGGN